MSTTPSPFATYEIMRIRISLCLLTFFAGCASDSGPPANVSVTRLDAPARAGSGEPNLSTFGDGVVLSWIQASAEGGHDLWVSTLRQDGEWAPRTRVVHGDDLFVNWADFPSVVADGQGGLWAHWLQRHPEGGAAYDVRLARSTDGGTTWTSAATPHEDGTATEHGFVSLLPKGSGIVAAWLDGRGYAPGADGSEPLQEMSLRYRAFDADGPAGPEAVLDARTCDCCQTDAAWTSEGPVLVYRNRTEDEVRDVYLARELEDGWSQGAPVHEDGWTIAGCPVNGPAVDAAGRRVVVAWFTAPGDQPRVNVAFSEDSGRTFGDPVRVDAGNPAGRVDVRLAGDGTAWVSWIERTGGEAAELRLGRFGPNGPQGRAAVVSASSSARASGFPRMVLAPWSEGEVVMAWTDVSEPGGPRVRVARVEMTP